MRSKACLGSDNFSRSPSIRWRPGSCRGGSAKVLSQVARMPTAWAAEQARASAADEKSTAMTSQPRRARKMALRPVPQAISRARPRGRRGSASARMAARWSGKGRADPRYRASQSSISERMIKEKGPSAEPKAQVALSQESRGRTLHAKGTTATAGALHVGVVELETRAFQCLDVVNLDAVQIHLAHLVHENFQTVELIDVVGFVDLVLESHVIAEARAAAAYDCHTKRCGRRVLTGHDFLDLTRGSRGNRNH